MSIQQQRVQSEGSEVERLRAEIARLNQELARAARPEPPEPTEPAPATKGGFWRWLVCGLALALVALLAPLAVVATWVHDEISDTGRYVETVTPLASDPAVQDAVTTRVTDEIFTRLDVQAVTQGAIDALSSRGLSPRAATALSALSTPLVNAIHDFVENAVGKLVRSEQFQQAWVAANRVAHTQMVAVLTGKQGGTIEVNGDTVTLNLAPVIAEVKSRLAAQGFSLVSKIPEVNAQFTLMQSNDITKAQTAFRLVGAVARALPVLALLLLGLAVLAAPSRRKALVIGALVVALSMVALGAFLNGFRAIYLDAIPSDQLPHDAAGAIYDQLVGFIRLNLRAVLVLFLAVAAIAWVSGPWAPAVATRRATNRASDWVRHGSDRAGLNTGGFGVAVYGMRTPIRIGVLGLALLVYVLAAHPTGAFTLVVLAVALAVLLIVELIARPPASSTPLPDDAGTPA